MMKSVALFLCLCVSLFASSSFAHNVSVNTDTNIDFDQVDLSTPSSYWTTVTHTENGTEFKGYFDLTITNNGQQAWGDFHFVIDGFDDVAFVDPLNHGETDPAPVMLNADSTEYSNYSASITNSGFKVDYIFYNNPLETGETATFRVYTDNTRNENEWFTIAFYPTPTPEPATIAILGIGAVFLIRGAKR